MMDMYSSDLLEHSQRGTGIILMWERKFVFAVSKNLFGTKLLPRGQFPTPILEEK